MQVFELASCLFLQAQSSSPTSAPAAICSISTHFFRATPLFSLKRQAFFKSRPQECYFCSLNNPLVNPRNCPHCGQKWTAGRRKASDLSPASPLAASPSAEIRPQAVFLLRLPLSQRSRTAVQRPVFGLPAGTRSAELRKPHKLPTRVRRRGSGVLAVRSTRVFNKIGIFPPCCVLVQLPQLPVVVLLKRRLNRSDCEQQVAVALASILRRNRRRLCDEQVAFFE